MKGLSQEIKSFKQIFEEYEFTYRSIDTKTSYYNKLIARGWRVPSAGSYYFYTTLAEANVLKQDLKIEVDISF